MTVLCRCLLVLSLLVAPFRLLAATAAEENAYRAAEKEFVDGFYQKADADFADFVQKFPTSTRVPEAIFWRAEARMKLRDFSGAFNLLSTHQAQAGNLGDEFLFLQAEAAYQKEDFRTAAALFTKLVNEFPSSPRRLAAVIRDASALGKLLDWPRVIKLLEQTNGVFQAAVSSNSDSELISRGLLLLAQARLAQGTYDAAEAGLQALSKRKLTPELDWQRQYLECRILLAKGQKENALQKTTNLLSLANASGQRELQAESAAFQGSILEQSGRVSEAIASYQSNLADGVPTARQRDALLKITQLFLRGSQVNEAAQVLEKFLTQFPGGEASDLALLTLGELRLRQQFGLSTTNATTNAPAAVNYLQQALSALQTLTNKFPQSSLVAKGELDLGWCYWLEGKMAQSESCFQLAVARLPRSRDQATARFKLADTQFQQTNHAVAIANFEALIADFANLPEVRTNLFEPALYQLVRAGLAATNAAVATNALAKILTEYSNSFYADRAVLLTGQEVGTRSPESARKLFLDFAAMAPAAPMMPEVRLAIARTFEQQEQYEKAIEQYDSWLVNYTNHPAIPQTMFYCALANFRAHLETNALNQFTNFIARYPADDLAQLAQWWVADYFFRDGKWQEAESNYQLCYQNTNHPASLLSYQARMMAGRAAFARQGWKDAIQYFTSLTSDLKCPPELWAQAMFAYADTLMIQDSTNRNADLQTAIAIFNTISEKFPNQPQAVLALGEKATCLLQLAQSASDYEPVTNALQQVLRSPAADARVRSIAHVGLGLTLQKIAEQAPEADRPALLDAALQHFLEVFYYEKIVHDGEKPDPFWTRKAGIEAAALLAEKLKRRTEAINVYRRLQEMFPPLQFEERIKSLQAQDQEKTTKS